MTQKLVCEKCGATRNLIRSIYECDPIYCKPCKKKLNEMVTDGILVMEEWKKKGYCCKPFWDSLQEGSSGYKHFASITMSDRNQFFVEEIEQPIKYCPWCGVDV